MLNIVIACDKAGIQMKNFLIESLKNDYNIINLGTDSEEAVDYPDFAKKLTDKIVDGTAKFGILICGTGIGMSICANKVKGIRAALCHNSLEAKLTREHNNSNVICLGARIIGLETTLDNVKTFLNTEFSNIDRHVRRINKIE